MALMHCHFFSNVLGLQTGMDVILPEPRPGQAARKLPTLYLLHGLSDDHTIWQRRTSIERYVDGLDLAVVMPSAHRSYYTNTTSEQHYWTFISEEVPFVARSFFPLSAAREENYVAGLSMGGYGAFKLALSQPDRFAAAASLSGALDAARMVQQRDNPGDLRYVFGDAPVAGTPQDLFHLAKVAAQGVGTPALYQWCGTEDFLYGDNVRFRDHLKAVGLPATYEEGPGGHDWACWDRQIQRVLSWLPGLGPHAP